MGIVAAEGNVLGTWGRLVKMGVKPLPRWRFGFMWDVSFPELETGRLETYPTFIKLLVLHQGSEQLKSLDSQDP